MRKSIIKLLLKLKKFLQEKFNFTDENIPFLITILAAFLLFSFGIYLFIELTDELPTESLATYDESITDFFVSNRNPALTTYLKTVTYIGNFYGYLGVVLLVCSFFYIKFKNWRYILELLTVLILASISNVVIKRIINRARPTEHSLYVLESLSYPSGHAMSAMAFYGFLIYLAYILKMKKLTKIVVIAILAILILSIGISRIYLGVHYPSDVAGGFIAGFIWVVFCAVLFHIIDLLRKKKKKRQTTAEKEAEPEMEN